MPTKLTLVMVAKVAPEILKTCLRSVKEYIDAYIIVVDPGDLDSHQIAAREILSDLPGGVFEHPWKNVAVNRTKAFQIAKEKVESDYLLVLDADDYLQVNTNLPPTDEYKFDKNKLTADIYELEIIDGPNNYWRPQIFKADLPNLRYEGSFHEYVNCDKKMETTRLHELQYIRIFASLTPEQQVTKYKKFIVGLKKELAADPTNARHAYYLAQSYKDAFMFNEALQAYKKRAEMPGWDEETWRAMYEAAMLHEKLNHSESTIIAAYLNAFEFRPKRAEPLYELARYLRLKKKHSIAFIFASQASSISQPQDERWLVDSSIYDWKAVDELAVSSFYVPGKRELSKQLHEHLVANPHVPEDDKARIRSNLTFF